MKKIFFVTYLVVIFVFSRGYLGAGDINLTRVAQLGTGIYKDIAVQGNYAYCAASYQGLDIIDTGSRSQPVRVGNCNISSSAQWVYVSGNYAYVASSDLLAVVDVSNPALPVQVGRFNFNEYVRDLEIKDNYAYAATRSQDKYALQIIDLSSPFSPVQVAEWLPAGDNYFDSLSVSGNYVYLGPGTLTVVDITDPTAPVTVVGREPGYNRPLDLHATGNYAFQTGSLSDYDSFCVYPYVSISDISNPVSPLHLCNYDLGCDYTGEVAAAGNYAYIANRFSGLYVIDISTPAAPTTASVYGAAGRVNALAIDGQHILTANEEGGMQILDVSTPANISLVGAFDHSCNIQDVTVRDNYAYAAARTDGLLIFDISTPSSPALVGSLVLSQWGRAKKVVISGDYAYVLREKGLHGWGRKTLYIIDISNPQAPALVSDIQATYDDADDFYVRGNYAYTVAEYSGAMEIFDISNPLQVNQVGIYYGPFPATANAIWLRRSHAYIAYSSSIVEAVDISNPTAPTLTSSFTVAGGAEKLSVKGDYAYVTGDRLSVLDVSSPSSPSLVGTYNYDSFGTASQLYVLDNYVYLANSSGLKVLDVSNPALPTLAADYNVPGTQAVYARDNYVYAGGAKNGKLLVLLREENTTPPGIRVNTHELKFAANTQGAVSGPRTVYVENDGGGTLDWEVTKSENWIYCSPLSGFNRGRVEIKVDARGLAAGTYTGEVNLNSLNAVNSRETVQVTLTIYPAGQTAEPFGFFETPALGTALSGSVPFTGWALDDVGIQTVRLFRETPDSLLYIGDAVLVEGARPDVELSYPGYPGNHKAGWGYMMLTNFLPNQGNGTFTIHAAAIDLEGNQVTLGTKTVTVNNANAVNPFGTIDTPAQGGLVSGGDYINFGWVLTPRPNIIPRDGSTIQVWLDGEPKGHPVYNIYRADIASLFPGYKNSDGAVGYFYLDTTQYDNGVHTMQWTAADNSGNIDGIGSRYFTIANNSLKQASTNRHGPQTYPADTANPLKAEMDFSAIALRTGFNEKAAARLIYPADNGVITIEIKELERIELNFEMKLTAAYQVVGRRYGSLPWGASLDSEKNIFYWQPGPGFIGRYRLLFFKTGRPGRQARKEVEVIIKPRF
jgi:hypothetical protein